MAQASRLPRGDASACYGEDDSLPVVSVSPAQRPASPQCPEVPAAPRRTSPGPVAPLPLSEVARRPRSAAAWGDPAEANRSSPRSRDKETPRNSPRGRENGFDSGRARGTVRSRNKIQRTSQNSSPAAVSHDNVVMLGIQGQRPKECSKAELQTLVLKQLLGEEVRSILHDELRIVFSDHLGSSIAAPVRHIVREELRHAFSDQLGVDPPDDNPSGKPWAKFQEPAAEEDAAPPSRWNEGGSSRGNTGSKEQYTPSFAATVKESPSTPGRAFGDVGAAPDEAGKISMHDAALENVASQAAHHFANQEEKMACVAWQSEVSQDLKKLTDFARKWSPFCKERLVRTIVMLGKIGKVEAPARTDFVSRFVDSYTFYTLMALVIMANCWFMVVAANEEIQLPAGAEPSAFVKTGELVFLAIYGVEFLMKIHRFRQFYFVDSDWFFNWLDLSLLAISAYFVFVSDAVVSVTWLRVLRICRAARVLRILELANSFQVLRALLISFLSSFTTLLWSMALLLVVLFIFSMAFVQRVASYFSWKGEDLNADEKESLVEAFGSVSTTMLTLYMCTTGGNDWSNYYEPLAPTGWLNQGLFLFFVGFAQLAVLNIILGIFVDKALKSMSAAPEDLAVEQLGQERKNASELKRLLRDHDGDQDGKLTVEDWRGVLEQGQVSAYLEVMGIRVQNVYDCFHAMSERHGEVDIDGLVLACVRMRGAASAFDLESVLEELKSMSRHMNDNHQEVRRSLMDFHGGI